MAISQWVSKLLFCIKSFQIKLVTLLLPHLPGPMSYNWLAPKKCFQKRFLRLISSIFLMKFVALETTRPHWGKVNIGSGNGLVQLGNKPLSEPMLTLGLCRHMLPPGYSELMVQTVKLFSLVWPCAGLILGLRPANERHRYKVTPSLIGWAQT